MSGKKTAKHMIALMSRQSLKTGRMRNIFVSITIVLAAALLTAILMFVQGQRTETARELSHAQQVGYYNLTDDQVQALASDERIAYQIRVKTGVLSDMHGFSAMPYYVSEMSDEIRIGELTEGTLPEKENEAAVQGAMLERMGIEPKVGSSVTLESGRTQGGNVSDRKRRRDRERVCESVQSLSGLTDYRQPADPALCPGGRRDPARLCPGDLWCILSVSHRQDPSVRPAPHDRHDKEAVEEVCLKRRTASVFKICSHRHCHRRRGRIFYETTRIQYTEYIDHSGSSICDHLYYYDAVCA